jgi:hypothetical protein
MKHTASVLLIASIVFWPLPAHSFKLSPCLRNLTLEDGQLGQESLRWQNACPLLPSRFKSAVHEHMSVASIQEYRGTIKLDRSPRGWRFSYMTEPPWSVKPRRQHWSRGIVFGNWWNDDPLMLTWGQGRDIIGGGLTATKFLKDGSHGVMT